MKRMVFLFLHLHLPAVCVDARVTRRKRIKKETRGGPGLHFAYPYRQASEETPALPDPYAESKVGRQSS